MRTPCAGNRSLTTAADGGARTFLSAAVSERHGGPNLLALETEHAAADRNVRAPVTITFLMTKEMAE